MCNHASPTKSAWSFTADTIQKKTLAARISLGRIGVFLSQQDSLNGISSLLSAPPSLPLRFYRIIRHVSPRERLLCNTVWPTLHTLKQMAGSVERLYAVALSGDGGLHAIQAQKHRCAPTCSWWPARSDACRGGVGHRSKGKDRRTVQAVSMSRMGRVALRNEIGHSDLGRCSGDPDSSDE
jgi:hypothetical protein